MSEIEDVTDLSLKALSLGGFKGSGEKSKSDKTVSSVKGTVTSDAVPPGVEFSVNTEAVSEMDSATEKYFYSFNNKKCGTCIVFNNMQFDERTGQKVRKGSDMDAKKVKDTFEMFGFKVYTYENSTCLQMWKTMQKESERDHSKEDCFVCVVLSHGARGKDTATLVEKDIIYGRDNFMFLGDLTKHVDEENCPTLAGKPKIFILQACRGTDLSEAVEFEEVTTSSGEKQTRPTEMERIASYHGMGEVALGYDVADAVPCDTQTTVPEDVPIEIDYLLVYSSPPGFFSFRSSEKGSFFISSLCEQLRRCYKSKDLMTILTRVNYQVAFLYESYAPSSRNNPKMRDIHQKKQMPWVASKLTKFVHFKEKS